VELPMKLINYNLLHTFVGDSVGECITPMNLLIDFTLLKSSREFGNFLIEGNNTDELINELNSVVEFYRVWEIFNEE
jgi:hypothetical protein